MTNSKFLISNKTPVNKIYLGNQLVQTINENYVQTKPELNYIGSFPNNSTTVSINFTIPPKALIDFRNKYITMSAYFDLEFLHTQSSNNHFGADMNIKFKDGTNMWNDFTKSKLPYITTNEGENIRLKVLPNYYKRTIFIPDKEIDFLQTLVLFNRGVVQNVRTIIKDVKFEIGKNATNWCPAKNDVI